MKTLKLFRFNNIQPHKDISPCRFQYQLFNGKTFLGMEYSDKEFESGMVTVEPAIKLELFNSIRPVASTDKNTFIIPVKVSK
jgi:hypothetical protein